MHGKRAKLVVWLCWIGAGALILLPTHHAASDSMDSPSRWSSAPPALSHAHNPARSTLVTGRGAEEGGKDGGQLRLRGGRVRV